MNNKKLLLDNSYIDYIKKIINVLLRKVMREDGKIKVKHIDLEDMPSSSVADHDGRYFTKTEHLTTSAGAADAAKPIKLNTNGLVDNTMLPHKVKVSENDTTTAFLEDKLDAGSGISLSVLNEGVNEEISISNSDTGSGAVSTHEGTYDHTKLHDPATVADTDSIDMTITGQEIKGDVRTQNSTTVDLSADGSGLKADLNSTLKSNYDTAYSNTHASGSDNQNLFATISADSGSTTADSQTDTLSVVGAGTVSTSITGDILTITGATSPDTNDKVKVNTDDSTAGFLEDKLVAGTGVSLVVAVDDSDITINNTDLGSGAVSTHESTYDHSELHASGSDNQNLFATITADSGSTTADSTTDTLSIVGAGTVSTSITGDTLTITGSGGPDTDEKVKVNSDDATEGYLEDKLTAGTGISLTTAVDDSDITIANTDTGSGAVGSHESTYNHSNYNTAYGWGDHASAGYFIKASDDLDDISAGTTNVHLTTTLKSNYDSAYSASHTRAHNFDGSSDHNGLASFTENNFLSSNANGLPKDSGSKASDFATSGHTHSFIDLTDTPSAYTSSAGKLVAVNSGADALEFITAPSGDDEKAKVSANDTTAGYLNGKLVAGEGIDLTEGSDGGDETLTISGEDATTTNKGVASFSSDNFSVSSGAVSIKSGGVDLASEITGTLPVGNGGTGLASLTANKMFYASDTYAIAQNDVYYDDIGKRLGINTDSHTRTLDVNGGVYVNAEFTGLGTVSVSASSTTVGGTSTKFQSQLRVGDYLTIDGITRTVATIASDTSLTVSSSFSSSALTDKTYTVLPLKAMEVVGDRINLKTTKTLDGSTQDVLVYRMEDATGQMGFFGYGQPSDNTLFLLYNTRGDIRLSPSSSGNVSANRVYGAVSSSGTGVFINNIGVLGTSTSSLKYKKDIITVKDKTKNKDIFNYRNILNIDAKLFKYTKDVLCNEGEEEREDIGFIVEDFIKENLEHAIIYYEGEPSALKYDRISAYHHEIIKDHEQEIKELMQKNEELEQRIKKLEEMILKLGFLLTIREAKEGEQEI